LISPWRGLCRPVAAAASEYVQAIEGVMDSVKRFGAFLEIAAFAGIMPSLEVH
jgi:ribosomal protein S1